MKRFSWVFAAFCVLWSISPATGQKNQPLKVCLVSGSLEYDSNESLAKLQKHLEKKYNIQCSWAKRKAVDDLSGLENLQTCDVAVFFTRRMTIKGEQLAAVKKYCQSGKPLVAIRTASHGFQNWLAFDRIVLGGNYRNHYPSGPICQVKIVPAAETHPILKGVKPFTSVASLYKNIGIAKDTNLLLTGSIPDHIEPLAWTRMHKRARVFYTSLGHPQDFDNEQFLRLITNAIFWTTAKQGKNQ